ncbi:Uncharacterised protein [uncultured archaeon]|nr:Uncharacterised protein [uncultured archaeon]
MLSVKQSNVLHNLNSAQVERMRQNIGLFVSQYRAGRPLLDIGLRGGQITPIINREKQVVVSAQQIEFYCEFIRQYGINLPDVGGYPILNASSIKKPQSEPIIRS